MFPTENGDDLGICTVLLQNVYIRPFNIEYVCECKDSVVAL